MSLALKNISKLYTPDLNDKFGSVKVLENVSVFLDNGIIIEIYEDANPQNKKADIVIDASGMCLFPGFVDAHTHPVFWQTRESEFIMRIKGSSYEEIAAAGGGIRNSARNFQKAPRDQIKIQTARRLAEFLIHGTTTIEAKSGYGLTTEDEIKSLQIIHELNSEQPLEMVPTFLGAHEIPDEYRSNRSEYIRIIREEMIPYIAEKKLAVYCDVFCEHGVFTVEESRDILNEARRYGLESRIHADELHPLGGAELAAEINAATADHLVKISDQGIQKLAHQGVIPVLLPVTTFFLRKDEYAPARKFIDAGCEIALATDFNPGSAMTQNMQLVWSVASLKMGLLPGELLWATTITPAKSLARQQLIGSIERGKQADLVLMDIPNIDYLPYHLGINHAFMTIKKGKIAFQRFQNHDRVNYNG